MLMYIFPRQFGLHNVFTSEVDKTKTSQSLQDYTVRDEEIAKLLRQTTASHRGAPKIPKRLRGTAKELARRLQIQHKRCSYYELLQHYCPCPYGFRYSRRHNTPKQPPASIRVGRSSGVKSKREALSTQANSHTQSTNCAGTDTKTKAEVLAGETETVVELACPKADVYAFCRATLIKLIPEAFWGSGDTGKHNRAVFLRKVHHFICLRRFETTSLHELLQDFRVSSSIAPKQSVARS